MAILLLQQVPHPFIGRRPEILTESSNRRTSALTIPNRSFPPTTVGRGQASAETHARAESCPAGLNEDVPPSLQQRLPVADMPPKSSRTPVPAPATTGHRRWHTPQTWYPTTD